VNRHNKPEVVASCLFLSGCTVGCSGFGSQARGASLFLFFLLSLRVFLYALFIVQVNFSDVFVNYITIVLLPVRFLQSSFPALVILSK
jgi:hypothetical protein